MKRVAFLDRDGVINEEVNYLCKIGDFQYIRNSIEGLSLLSEMGFELIIITNQAGIAKGFFSKNDHAKLAEWLISDLSRRGVQVLDYIFCPHHPNGVVDEYIKDCGCRKPNPGMLLNAKEKYDINFETSILIGDKVTDICAGRSAGVKRAFLVESGHAISAEERLENEVFPNLYGVACALREELSCS